MGVRGEAVLPAGEGEQTSGPGSAARAGGRQQVPATRPTHTLSAGTSRTRDRKLVTAKPPRPGAQCLCALLILSHQEKELQQKVCRAGLFPRNLRAGAHFPLGAFSSAQRSRTPPQCRVSRRSKSNADFLLQLRKLFVKLTTVSGFCCSRVQTSFTV